MVVAIGLIPLYSLKQSSEKLEVAAKTILLETLDINKMEQGSNRPRQVGENANMYIDGRQYFNGIHSQTESKLYIVLDGKALYFTAEVGVDDRSTAHRTDTTRKENSYAEFFVIGDGQILWESGVMKYGQASKPLHVDLTGIMELQLKATGGPGHTHVDWVDAYFTYMGARPKTAWSPEANDRIRQSKRYIESLNEKYPEPRINGAMVVGIRPNTPFYYPMAVTGKKPITYQATGLPKGLKIDDQTGIISGVPANEGEYEVMLQAKNGSGSAKRTLKISVGDKLALTPPMGFLSWNVIQGTISETFLKDLANTFVDLGLRDVGYQYINMDDCWHGFRDSCGYITPNPVRFPNGMKVVGDYLHDRGLKFGIYSTPGPRTCAGLPGTMNFETLDVNTWESWGVDYLKYDRCKTPPDRADYLYALMGDLLSKSERSIVYCGKKAAGSQLWRVGGDLRDEWTLGGGGHVGILESIEHAFKYADMQEPGGWNDPDMLVVGINGKGASGNDLTDESGCTDTEYRSHMSLWAMMSAPLFITADVRQIDPISLETLTNPEVIEIDQDPLGDFPERIVKMESHEIWLKEMSDGTKAIALFNKSEDEKELSVDWKEIGLSGSHKVRDLWKRADVGKYKKGFSSSVPSHGVRLIRIY